MKQLLRIVILLLLSFELFAQQNVQDSLKRSLSNAVDDSSRYIILRRIYDYYEETSRDSAFYYAHLCLQLAQKNKQKLAEIHCLDNKAYQLIGLGRYAEALQYLLEAIKMAEDKNNERSRTWELFSAKFNAAFAGNNRLLMLAYTHHIFGILMWQTDNNDQAIVHFREARRISLNIRHSTRQMMAAMNLGRSYLNINQVDSALMLEKEAEQLAFKTNFTKYLGQVYSIIGGIYEKKNDPVQQMLYYRLSIQTAKEQNNLNSLSSSYFIITKFFLAEQEKDSALYYAMKNLEIIKQLGPVTGLTVNPGTVYENIYLSYKLSGEKDSLFKYQGLTLTVKDSLYKIRIKNLTEFQNVGLNEQLRLQNAEKEKITYENKIRTWFMLAGIAVLLLLAVIFYINNRQKLKAKLKIEQAYDHLKATQQQLIHSEKMASLGELTAGIAHEIQNPLNFVNNFSEVNTELLIELNEEINKGNYNEVKAIAKDITENEGKINQHGKRADAIVKGMLQHSRSSTGKNEPVDINSLCDEYLRLAYHGLRAKDNSFNATLATDFDPTIQSIQIQSQEMGRVILNLINNALYAVGEKRKQIPNDYEPKVTIRTKRNGLSIEISVEDNGMGIPVSIKGKIFQPFFTTKPTGQGTGLGLSLSYDIVKAHGGELTVETQEGLTTIFKIKLPSFV